MRRLLKHWSHILNATLLIALVWALMRDTYEPPDLTTYTQQDLDKAVRVSAGMKPDEVEKLMGLPVRKELSEEREEWHYCRTGEHVDEYIAIRFHKGLVAELEHYSVSYLDLIFHHTATPSEALIAAGGLGDCKLTIRWGSYGQRAPNERPYWVYPPSAAQQGAPGDGPRPAGSARP